MHSDNTCFGEGRVFEIQSHGMDGRNIKGGTVYGSECLKV